MAYEMPDIDGLMRGAGRVRSDGYEIMWGVGRHGPGNNVFTYFVEPNGFVTEYTTEVDQVDNSYVAHDAQWWIETKLFPCRWKMAGAPSDYARKAMSGELVEEEPALRAGDGARAGALVQRSDHSGLIFAALMIGAHLSISDLSSVASVSGLEPSTA